jgi:hypothetical protein
MPIERFKQTGGSDIQPIPLPELSQTHFDLGAASLQITAGLEGTHPLLDLGPNPDAFTYVYDDGRLHVEETQSGTHILSVYSGEHGSGRTTQVTHIGSIVAENIVFGNKTVSYDGTVVFSEGATVIRMESGERLSVHLTVPEGHEISSHSARTQSGSMEVHGVSAVEMKLSSLSGDMVMTDVNARNIAIQTLAGKVRLRDSTIDDAVIGTAAGKVTLRDDSFRGVGVQTVSGDVKAREVTSQTPVKVQTVSGDISIEDSSAPSWNLRTVTGDITTELENPVYPRTVTGRIRER